MFSGVKHGMVSREIGQRESLMALFDPVLWLVSSDLCVSIRVCSQHTHTTIWTS
jgi:hypothetical protein